MVVTKFLPLMFLLLALLGAEPARAAFISGHSYTSVADWASANGFRVQMRRGNGILLTNRAQSRLMLQKDSRTAQISGVNVALSFPVIADRGEFLVAQLDWAKTVNPLFFPSRFSGKKIFTIVLDPGHGGKDPGNQAGGHNEKTCTLALANELHDQLVHAGFNVLLTRTKDRFVELAARPDLANRQHADLFVSLHFNATETGKAEVSGPETYCITPVGASSSNAQGEGANHGACPANRVEDKSLRLAYQVQKSLVRNLAAEDRSVRRARFAVLRDAAMPAILVESGYMTHPTEGRRILDAGYRKMIAAAIVTGILNYQKFNGPTPGHWAATAFPVAPVKSSKRKK
jgi:N-acetylmuramoyl-L-alanine amidase